MRAHVPPGLQMARRICGDPGTPQTNRGRLFGTAWSNMRAIQLMRCYTLTQVVHGGTYLSAIHSYSRYQIFGRFAHDDPVLDLQSWVSINTFCQRLPCRKPAVGPYEGWGDPPWYAALTDTVLPGWCQLPDPKPIQSETGPGLCEQATSSIREHEQIRT